MQSTASRIVRLHPAWRYWLPIQSPGQLLMFGAIVAIGLAVLGAITVHMDPAPPVAGSVACVIVAASIPLYGLLPGRMEIHAGCGATEMFDRLHHHIIATGYMQTSAGDAIRRYGSSGPRWQRWNESRVSLSIRDASTLRVEGAKLALKEITRWLETAQHEVAARQRSS